MCTTSLNKLVSISATWLRRNFNDMLDGTSREFQLYRITSVSQRSMRILYIDVTWVHSTTQVGFEIRIRNCNHTEVPHWCC